MIGFCILLVCVGIAIGLIISMFIDAFFAKTL